MDKFIRYKLINDRNLHEKYSFLAQVKKNKKDLFFCIVFVFVYEMPSNGEKIESKLFPKKFLNFLKN